MPGDSESERSDNFFGALNTERCGCGHRINVTDPREHTCDPVCQCSGCKDIIKRQLLVIEED